MILKLKLRAGKWRVVSSLYSGNILHYIQGERNSIAPLNLPDSPIKLIKDA